MTSSTQRIGAFLLTVLVTGLAACGGSGQNDAALVAEGKQTFRFDTFGDETKWTDALRIHEVVATVDPTTALAVGLKVDSEALPAECSACHDVPGVRHYLGSAAYGARCNPAVT